MLDRVARIIGHTFLQLHKGPGKSRFRIIDRTLRERSVELVKIFFSGVFQRFFLNLFVKAVSHCSSFDPLYVEAPDKSSGKRKQKIHICYDLVGFIPVDELLKAEQA